MEEIRCLIWLLMVFGAGNPRIWKMLQLYETAQHACEVLRDPQSDPDLHLPEHTLRRIRQTDASKVDEMLERCEKQKLSILSYEDDAYPDKLRSIVNPPVLLFYRGDVSVLQNDLLLTIVGTRNPSEYSLHVERRICNELVQMQFVPVTGYAVGIDITANLCAMQAGSPSIALMGCGLDIEYPKSHANLKNDIAENGLILSEFFPGTMPASVNFPIRNRVLSGLSMGTFVVQAPERSGALITADYALEQGRDVFCLPPVDIFDKQYMGVIKYLRAGAIPVFDSQDIVFEYYTSYAHMIAASSVYDKDKEKSENPAAQLEKGILEKKKAEREQPPESEQKSETEPESELEPETESAPPSGEPDPVLDPMPEEDLDGLAGEVLSLLQRQRIMHVDRIADELEIPMGQLTTILTELELYGKIERRPGKQYQIG